MRSRFPYSLLVLALFLASTAVGQGAKPQGGPKTGGDFSNNLEPEAKVPTGVILVKGAWSSASDSVTPQPAGGNETDKTYSDPYFGITYPLPSDWTEAYKGPPPSDPGRYVLAQLRPGDTFKG